MIDIDLKNIDPEDIEDVLIKVEDSFNIRFGIDELKYVETFGQLRDIILIKLALTDTGGCTTQQAFYKLRDAINAVTLYGKITPETLLADILPRGKRLSTVKRIENQLGFKLKLLQPPKFVTVLIAIGIFSSIGYIFYNWIAGLSGILVFIGASILATKTGSEFRVQTVGQLASLITRESYYNSRRIANTFNRSEINQVLIDLFVTELDLPSAN
jgi:hypothetical protein